MKTVVEAFIYEVPDDYENYITADQFIEFVHGMTCPFYDGTDNFIPDFNNHYIEEMKE